MAEGTFTIFDEAKVAILNKEHEFDADTFKLAILDNTSTMAANTSSPAYGHANFVEIGTSGNYTGPITLTTQSVTNTSGTVKFDADDITVLKSALHDQDARWGLLYNDTHLSDSAIGYLDFGDVVDMSDVDLVITWATDGIFDLA